MALVFGHKMYIYRTTTPNNQQEVVKWTGASSSALIRSPATPSQASQVPIISANISNGAHEILAIIVHIEIDTIWMANKNPVMQLIRPTHMRDSPAYMQAYNGHQKKLVNPSALKYSFLILLK